MNRFKIYLLISSVCLILFSCGEGTVEIDESTYEPKIVINGFIYPGKKIDRIKITRNFPLNTTIKNDEIPIKDAFVTVTDENSNVDTLFFNNDSGYYQAAVPGLTILGGHSYRLNVSAEIDGEKLSASSTTTVPDTGFKINHDLSCQGDIPYRQFTQGKIEVPYIIYSRSAGAEFYALSGAALDADMSNFIDVNVYGVDEEVVEEYFDYFKYFETWAAPDNRTHGTSKLEIPWWFIYFYGRYRAILYAGDLNFYHFFVTHKYVQDIDGNLREPLFYIEGDGIGVFGSAITDTVYFSIVPN